MPLTITDSEDISILDSKITADLCQGKLFVDVTPSEWVGAGDSYVEGASIKIVNPLDVTVKDFLSSGYDIEAPMTDEYSYTLPLIANNYLYGDYIVTVRLTDSEGNDYELEKTVNICPPNKKNKTKKTGCLSAKIIAKCKEGKALVMLNQPPVYKGKNSESQVNDLELEYPTGSEEEVHESTIDRFSVRLYQGVYKLTGTVCATYNYGKNVFFKIPYTVDCEKKVVCILDECCVQGKLEELKAKVDSDCTQEEKDNTSSIIVSTLFYLKLAQMAQDCGEDPSDHITELEKLLGCTCSCNCDEGSPIFTGEPGSDYTFEGCGFVEETVGLTKKITLYNRSHRLVAGSSNVVIGDPVIDQENCEVTQTVTVSNPDPFQICAAIEEEIQQANGVNPSTYRLLAIVDPIEQDTEDGCFVKGINAATGFAVAGPDRQSFFGKMEWFDTLTEANADAESGETVLIYLDTDEDLALKTGVNYSGHGQRTIGNLTCADEAEGYEGSLSNLTVDHVDLNYSALTGMTVVNTTGVIVTGTLLLDGGIKWVGGYLKFNQETSNFARLLSRASMSHFYSTMPFVINGSGTVSNFDIEFSGVQFNYYNGFIGALQGTSGSYKISSGNVYSVNTIGSFFSADVNNIAPLVSNFATVSEGNIGLMMLISPAATGSSITTANIVAKGGAGDGAKTYYNYTEIPGNSNYDVNMRALINGITGYSISQHGLNSRSAGYQYSMGLSELNYAINLAKGTDYAPNLTTPMLEYVSGKSLVTAALFSSGNCYVIGGSFESDSDDATLGSPVFLDFSESEASNYNYFIRMASMTARNPAAYAVRKATAAAELVIAGCHFISRYADNTAGVQPTITLKAVTIDAYGNIY